MVVILSLQFVACTNDSDTDYEDIDLELIAVSTGGKCGYIDRKGNFIINPQFSDANNFYDGLAYVRFNGKVGYINKAGNFVIPAIYEDGTDFVDGLAFVTKVNSTPICIDTKGNEIFQTPANIETVEVYSKEGIARVKTDNGKENFIDKKGNIVINPQYMICDYCNDGIVIVQSEDNKCGAFNKEGKMIVNPQFRWIGCFRHGLAKVYTGEKCGYIDQEGRYAINPQFNLGDDFSDNGLAAVKKGERWGYINTKGEYVINPQFDLAKIFYDGLAVVKLGDKYGIINSNGDYVANPQFDLVKDFFNGVAVVKLGGKYGAINSNGKYVVNPQFDEINTFRKNGLASMVQNGKYGYVNSEGCIVATPQFDYATRFFGNIAFVKSNGKWGIIDEQGEYIVNPQFDWIMAPINNIIHSTVLCESPIIDKILYLNSILNETYANTVGINGGKGKYNKNEYKENLRMSSPIKNENAEMDVSYIFDEDLQDITRNMAKLEFYQAKIKLCNKDFLDEHDPYLYKKKVAIYTRKIMDAIEEKEYVKFESLDESSWYAENQSIYVLIYVTNDEPRHATTTQTISVVATKIKGLAHQFKISINNLIYEKSNDSENNEYESTTTNNQQSDINAQSINDAPTNSKGPKTTNEKITIPGDYPDASIRNLSSSELSGYSKRELKLMRNEIFARHGYIFKTDDMKKHFSSKQWYEPKYNDVNSMLTDIEQQNIKTIQQLEK